MRAALEPHRSLRRHRAGPRDLRPPAPPRRPRRAERRGRPVAGHGSGGRRLPRRPGRGGHADAVERPGGGLVRRPPDPEQPRRERRADARREEQRPPPPPPPAAPVSAGLQDPPSTRAPSTAPGPCPASARHRATRPTRSPRAPRAPRAPWTPQPPSRRTPRRRGCSASVPAAVPAPVRVACLLTWVFSGSVALMYLAAAVALVVDRAAIVDRVVATPAWRDTGIERRRARAAAVVRRAAVPGLEPRRDGAGLLHLASPRLGALPAGGQRRGRPAGRRGRLPGRDPAPARLRRHDRHAVLAGGRGRGSHRRGAARHRPPPAPPAPRRGRLGDRRWCRPGQRARSRPASGAIPSSSTSRSLQKAHRTRWRPSSEPSS